MLVYFLTFLGGAAAQGFLPDQGIDRSRIAGGEAQEFPHEFFEGDFGIGGLAGVLAAGRFALRCFGAGGFEPDFSGAHQRGLSGAAFGAPSRLRPRASPGAAADWFCGEICHDLL